MPAKTLRVSARLRVQCCFLPTLQRKLPQIGFRVLGAGCRVTGCRVPVARYRVSGDQVLTVLDIRYQSISYE